MIITRRADRVLPENTSTMPKFSKRQPIKSFSERFVSQKSKSPSVVKSISKSETFKERYSSIGSLYDYKEHYKDYQKSENILQRKTSGSNPTKFNIRVGEASAQGCRPTMEDRSIICKRLQVENAGSLICDEHNHVQLHAVLDGHGGSGCSQWMSENLVRVITEFLIREETVEDALRKAFECADQVFLKKGIKGGSTCIAVLIEEATQTAWVCNLGDSRSVFSNGWQSKDHRPSAIDEQLRVELAGGTVMNDRVMGLLAVSRAFGDQAFKSQGVIATPEITKHDLSKMKSEHGSHLFCILACDGLWDYLSTHLALSLASDGLMLGAGPEDVCWGLIRAALDEKSSRDNVSVLLMQFN